MEKWAKKTAFIAGANSGMGAAITRRFLECDLKVYAMDRNVEFLNVRTFLCFHENLAV